MSKNLVIASSIAAGILIWLLSGVLTDDSGVAEHESLAVESTHSAPVEQTQLPRVRAVVLRSEPRTRYLVLRGKTESKRMVDVKAEISGNIVSRPVERGMRVEQGELLCEVAVDDREAAVAEAKASLEEARIEHQGSLKLQEQGLLSATAIAKSGARLEAARADVRRQALNLDRTRIVAPFGGVVEQLQMNVGDYAVPGAACATLIDLDPMLIIANVTENEVENLAVGDQVAGRISNGRDIAGVVTFVGKQSDPVTRTYPVEITVENADYAVRSGLTVNVRIGLGEVYAHQITPALFALDDAGAIGVRTLGKNNVVEFHTVRIIEDGPGGVWVTGLPDTTRLITVGQEFVDAGQEVDAVYPSDPSAQVAQP
jgi:multidrug efflux system membrane fusion protein